MLVHSLTFLCTYVPHCLAPGRQSSSVYGVQLGRQTVEKSHYRDVRGGHGCCCKFMMQKGEREGKEEKEGEREGKKEGSEGATNID